VFLLWLNQLKNTTVLLFPVTRSNVCVMFPCKVRYESTWHHSRSRAKCAKFQKRLVLLRLYVDSQRKPLLFNTRVGDRRLFRNVSKILPACMNLPKRTLFGSYLNKNPQMQDVVNLNHWAPGIFSGGKVWSTRKAGNLTAICESIVSTILEPRRLTGLWTSTACFTESFITFHYLGTRSWVKESMNTGDCCTDGM
jgi:hypothetical protein